MSDYTPTTEEIADWYAHKGGTGEFYNSRLTKRVNEFDRWLAQYTAEVRAAALAEQSTEEPEGEHVFIEQYGMYHAKFGGIGGDVTSLGLTREAWKALGEADVLAVSVLPVEQEKP